MASNSKGKGKKGERDWEKERLAQAKFDAELVHDRLRKERDDLQTKLDAAKQRINTLEKTEAFVSQLDPTRVRSLKIAAKQPKGTAEATAIWMMGDWHVGEFVDPATVNGKNEYTAAIEEESIRTAFKTQLYWTDLYRNGTKVDTLILNLGGDIITGHIHMDQVETSRGAPERQCLTAFGYLVGGIDFTLKEGKFKEIVIVCTVGNHGRDTDKVRPWTMAEHSYEWFLYHMLSIHYANEDRIRFVLPEGYFVYQEVYDYVCRFSHGNNITYNKGVGGVAVPLKRAIPRWNDTRHADYDFLHHFHTRETGRDYVINGSVVGYSPYAQFRGWPYDRPAQTFVLLDKRRGIVSVNPVFVRIAP